MCARGPWLFSVEIFRSDFSIRGPIEASDSGHGSLSADFSRRYRARIATQPELVVRVETINNPPKIRIYLSPKLILTSSRLETDGKIDFQTISKSRPIPILSLNLSEGFAEYLKQSKL